MLHVHLAKKDSSLLHVAKYNFLSFNFRALLVLPDIGNVRTPRELNDKAVYIFRLKKHQNFKKSNFYYSFFNIPIRLKEG